MIYFVLLRTRGALFHWLLLLNSLPDIAFMVCPRYPFAVGLRMGWKVAEVTVVPHESRRKCQNLLRPLFCACLGAARSRSGVCAGGAKCMEKTLIYIGGSGTLHTCETTDGGFGVYRYTELEAIAQLAGSRVFVLKLHGVDSNIGELAGLVGVAQDSPEWVKLFKRAPEDGDVVVADMVLVSFPSSSSCRPCSLRPRFRSHLCF
jgi:hypothetical protein